jgi:hypothetical protein
MQRLAGILLSLLPAYAEGRITATGTVIDQDGKPIENATVMVYSAGVRIGYDQFCPTCYLDCGKRATTDANGAFSIAGLSPDLLFTLLVVRDGYSSAFVHKHDPAKAPAHATMRKRTPPADPKQTVLGRVVDSHGDPVRDALITQQGVIFDKGRSFGDNGWIDLIAVSNRNGEFELSHTRPATAAILEVAPRAMAPALATLQTGSQRQTVTVTEGATVRGRLVYRGKALPNAELTLSSHSRISGTTFKEARIGTNAAGEFVSRTFRPDACWIWHRAWIRSRRRAWPRR